MSYISEQQILYEMSKFRRWYDLDIPNLYFNYRVVKYIETNHSYKYLFSTFLKPDQTKACYQFLKSPIAMILGNDIHQKNYITLQKILKKEYILHESI